VSDTFFDFRHGLLKVDMHPESLGQDLRIGLRVLRKERSFSILAIVVLALGICGVTTMFSVVNGVMLRGFSFPNADRLAAPTSWIRRAPTSSASTARSARWTSRRSVASSSRSIGWPHT
jgi:hypothetical protein